MLPISASMGYEQRSITEQHVYMNDNADPGVCFLGRSKPMKTLLGVTESKNLHQEQYLE